jgi:hypothetical protein
MNCLGTPGRQMFGDGDLFIVSCMLAVFLVFVLVSIIVRRYL